MKFHVPDMSCAHCKSAIEKAVASLDDTALVAVDLDGKTVDVTSTASADQLVATLQAIGFDASPVSV